MMWLLGAASVLAIAGFHRTKRWQKVGTLEVLLAFLAAFAVLVLPFGDGIACVLAMVAVVVVAPPWSWLPLGLVAACALAVEPIPVLKPTIDLSPGRLGTSTVVTEYFGSKPEFYTGPPPTPVPWIGLLLAAGLLAWAMRTHSVLGGVVALAFGGLVIVAPLAGAALLPLVAAVLVVLPRNRVFPFAAAGVGLLALVVFEWIQAAYPDMTPLSIDEHLARPEPTASMWTRLAAVVVACGLVVWSVVRRNFVGVAVAVVALATTWLNAPPRQPMLAFDWTEMFPAAWPALVLLGGALLLQRQTRWSGA